MLLRLALLPPLFDSLPHVTPPCSVSLTATTFTPLANGCSTPHWVGGWLWSCPTRWLRDCLEPEAKDLGVGTGQPIHQVPHDVRRQLKVLSANLGLYGDLSGRVASVLRELFPESRFTQSTSRLLPPTASRSANTSAWRLRPGPGSRSGPASLAASESGPMKT